MKYWALHPVNLFFFLFFNRHKWEVHCGSGWRVSWHMEYQPLGGRVHQLELHNSERKEVHSQENGRQQSRPGQPQLLQVKCFLTWWWNYYYFFFMGKHLNISLLLFPNPGILTMTALLGVSSIKARRSSGSSALCPNVLKVQFHKKLLNRNAAVSQLNALYRCLFLADKYQGCALGSGLSYRGTASVTKSGSHCLPWDNPALTHKLNNAWRSDALELGLGSHNFCR